LSVAHDQRRALSKPRGSLPAARIRATIWAIAGEFWFDQTVSKAEECRRLAERCLAAAQTISSEDVRAALLQRAQLWLDLAEWQEKQEEEGLTPPSSIEQAQPPAQQQQQLQPKDQEGVIGLTSAVDRED
jgi:hypothetical protein